MPIRHLTNVAEGNTRSAKKAERPTIKARGKDGKDFAFFIPFILTEKKSGKKERPGEKR